MRASTHRRALLALIAGGSLGLRAHAQAPGPERISVQGDVLRPLQLDRTALAAFPADEQGSSGVVRQVDGQERRTNVRGVRLRAVLERAGLAERDRLDWRKTVVLATASDGYRAVFAWPELVNTEAGAQVLVVYERDSQPLGAGEGPIALLAAADLRAGPRHVKWLARIEVRILRD
jgi:DMSO/TMAO reductase YedYZ molybdopterin-dependent catalytic subunit